MRFSSCYAGSQHYRVWLEWRAHCCLYVALSDYQLCTQREKYEEIEEHYEDTDDATQIPDGPSPCRRHDAEEEDLIAGLTTRTRGRRTPRSGGIKLLRDMAAHSS